MADKIPFTQHGLASLMRRSGERLIVPDPKTPGLRAELRPSGVVTFYVVKRRRGAIRTSAPIRYHVGTFPELTVDDARAKGQEALSQLAKGIDPNAMTRKEAQEPTFGELFTLMMELPPKRGRKRRGQDRRGRTVAEYERLRDKFLTPWLKRRASSIESSDVEKLHAKIGKDSGKYQANRVLAIVVAAFNAGIERKVFSLPNPAESVTRFTERSRDRYLTPDELPKFWNALDKEPPLLADFFRIALLTGARRSNVQAMAWADIDLTNGIWRVPGEQSKNGEPLYVILPTPATEILRRRQENADGAAFVFPSRGAAGHLVEPKSSWKRVCEAAGLVDVRLHDLRRSLGSWMAFGNSSLPIIGTALGHKSTATTEVYARLASAPVRAAVEAATAAIVSAAKVTTESKDTKTTAKPRRRAKGAASHG